jgi:TonB family protein
MKYTILSLTLMLIMFAGCTPSRQAAMQPSQPELVSMTSLPTLMTGSANMGLKFNVLFHVMKDGTVSEVRLETTSGDAEWDASAIDSMKQWRFTAPSGDGSTIDRWIRSVVIVQIQHPLVLTLGELLCADKQEADSLYALLIGGADFNTLARQPRVAQSARPGGFLGSVDIATFPKHVRDQLRKLTVNDFTRPLRVGAQYIIYMKYNPTFTPNIPQ